MKGIAMITKKRVEWSYATSINAERFGFGQSGCFTVATVKYTPTMRPPKPLAGFATLNEARAYAESLPQQWDNLTM